MSRDVAEPTAVMVRTERLLLRRVREDDADDFLTWRGRPDVVRYMYQPPWTAEVAREKLASWVTHPFRATGDVLVLAVELDGVVVGEGLLKRAPGEGQVEIGYAFHPDVAGRGLATEASGALLALAFGRFGFHRAFARIDAENTASVRVAQRLGMRLEARLVENDVRPADGVWSTELVYAVLASEHEARRRTPVVSDAP
ncbi:N-acetyltransferase [Xylanimonas oleitrophica]|uniref:N-acetyltransferase n=1 Tax=Xylanimonas oleitrophica TaxID=2607479 RepID=A0A2W5WMI5_9MICO|nr:GNAT family N-acetyltransferase [Xylanimonas oleitrophica]PZR51943.1 N-acetyltransferase [Xylanimonas oleitrophica]